MTTPIFILVDPQMGENIGATARAMMNCGITHLRLVNPRDGWPSEKAHAMSSGALDMMPPVTVFETVKDAIADCHTVYSTAALPRDMVKPIMTARAAAMDMQTRIKNNEKIAVLFGRERSGLSNEEIALSHTLISIPTNPDFSSLNLAQAALLVGYEYLMARYEGIANYTPTGKSFPAAQKDFDELMVRLETDLTAQKFFRVDEMKDQMMQNIRNLFTRAQPTDQEIKTFHGVISALIGKKIK
jgi:tRNA/rRNA methyltransferase